MVVGRKAWVASLVLTIAGLGISGYLTYVHYGDLSPLCGTGGCEKVQQSDYAIFAGIPIAMLGLLGYAAILGSLFVPGDAGRLAFLGLTIAGFGFSVYLVYLQLAVIDAVCQWCIASEVVMTGLCALALVRFFAEPTGYAEVEPGS